MGRGVLFLCWGRDWDFLFYSGEAEPFWKKEPPQSGLSKLLERLQSSIQTGPGLFLAGIKCIYHPSPPALGTSTSRAAAQLSYGSLSNPRWKLGLFPWREG